MTSLASVFVEVRPDTSGFSAELKTTLSKTREAVDVAAKLDASKLKPQLAALKADLKTLQLTKATISADTAQANAKVKALKLDLQGLNQQVKIDGKTDELTAKIEAVKAEIASVSGGKAKLGIDSAQASAHLKVIQAQLSVFDHTKAKAKLEVDSKGVNFAFRGISSLTTAIVSLAPVAVPALATVAAGVGILGSALMTAGGAGGAFGLSIMGQVQAFKEHEKNAKIIETQVTRYSAALDSAKSALAATTAGTDAHRAAQERVTAATKDYNEVLKNQKDEQKDFDKYYGATDRGLRKVKAAFTSFTQATSKETSSVLGKGLTLAADILPRLVPLANAAAHAVGGLLSDLGRFSKSREFQGLLNMFQKYGPIAITSFGHIAGNVIMGIINLFKSFVPYQNHFLGGFENMTRSFKDWSAGFSKSGGFQRFMAYAQRVLPDVRDLFVNLTEFVGKFVVALGPLAGIELKALTSLLRGLNNLPPKALSAIAFGITGIVLGLKAWELGTKAVTIAQSIMAAKTKALAAAQWLLNAAMDANPIGLVVLALAALVGGFILAYKKSETFRNIVNGAMNGVKKVASDVTGWFTASFAPVFTKKIPAAFQAVVGWVRRNWPWILGALTGPIGLATVYITRHWSTITGAFQDAKNWVVGAFKRSWSAVKGVIMTPINDAKTALQHVLGRGGPIRTAFSAAVSAIGTIWKGLQGLVRAPVHYIVDTVYMQGIRKVVGLLPGKNPLPVMHFARGGEVPMWAGERGKDSVPAMLMPGEHVWTASDVTKAGGHGAVKAMRNAVQKFAKGGAVWPTVGRRVSTYRGHDGVDINQPPGPNFGAPIYAWRSGRITYAGWGRGYGHAIFEKAPGFPEVVYGHGSTVYVHSGQSVRAGQRIGRVGATGNASGPHLHFGHPGGTSQLAMDLLRGAGSMGGAGNAGGGGGGGGHMVNDYHGLSLAAAAQKLNPARWIRHLRGMAGGWGGVFADTVRNMAGSAGGFVSTKIKAAIKAATHFVSNAAGAVTGYAGAGPKVPGGQGVARWAPTVRAVLNDLHAPQSLLGAVLRRMNQESGGNPRAENRWDSNFVAGHPSVGLMQVIRGTYNAYKPHPDFGPYMQGVSINPYSNIYAGLNYARHQYPSIAYAMNKPGGYDQGGIARGIGYMPKHTIAPERVLSPRQTESFDRLVAVLERGGGASSAPLIGHATIEHQVDLERYERQRAFRERMTNVGG